MLVLERRALQELGAAETCLLRALLEAREHSVNLDSLDLSGQDDGARPGFWQGMAHLHKGRLRQVR